VIARAGATLALLWTIATGADALAAALRLPAPGLVLGFPAVYAALAFGLVRLEWMEPTCSFLARNLAFFLIPVAAGLLDDGPLLERSGLQIVAVVAASAALGLTVTGRLAQRLMAPRPPRRSGG
jgi:holin-like protein